MCVCIHHICRETHGMFPLHAFHRHINAHFIKSTSTDRASRRPVASSRVPRAWIQKGRGNPLWHIYSHSGRQCRPLTTNVPRGVRNPNNKGCRVHMSEWKSCTISDHGFIYRDRLVTVCHDGSYELRAGSEAILPVVTSGAVITDKHAPLQRRHQPTPL